MKRKISFVLVLALVVSLFSLAEVQADGSSTLTVNTRTSDYVFNVGDTFSYTYWLDLEPDNIDYFLGLAVSEDSPDIEQVIRDAEYIEDAEYLDVKRIQGYVGYDPELVRLVGYEIPEQQNFPELKNTRCLQIDDPIAQMYIVGGSILDFFKDGLAFAFPDPLGLVGARNTQAFQQCRKFITLRFKVLAGSAEPMVLRTKLRDIDVVTSEGREVKLVDDGQANFCQLTTYETVNDEAPTMSPSTLVDEAAFDVRFFDASGVDITNLRPGPGAEITMTGVTLDGRYVTLKKTIAGQEVVNALTGSVGDKIIKFYDVPYGQYVVTCTYIDDQGTYYCTTSAKEAEVVTVPFTGGTQALWLVKTDGTQYMRANMHITWVGDNGSLASRPDYLLVELRNGDEIVKEKIVTCDSEDITIDSIPVFDDDGNEIDYTMNVSAIAIDNVSLYDIEVEKLSNTEYNATCTFIGAPEVIQPPDEHGHYWVRYSKPGSESPTCLEPGYYYEQCTQCMATRRVLVEPLGHSYVDGHRDPTCEHEGYIGYVCVRCGEADPDSEGEIIPALGHEYSPDFTVDIEPTCTAGGYKSHHCIRCTASIDSTYIPALGHDYQLLRAREPGCRSEGYTGDIECTRCGDIREYGEVIPANGHHEELVGEKKPTCTLAGYTGDIVCTDCGMILTHGVVIPATGHDFSKVIDYVPATCTEDGYTGDTVCANCGKHDHAGEVIPATGHKYRITDELAATETTRGYIEYTCEHCGHSYQRIVYPGCPAKLFKDVNTSAWYHEAIDFVLNYNIMHGVSDNMFEPDATLTRAMVVTILYNYANEPLVRGSNPFTDVADDAWYNDCVTWAYSNEIISGYEDNTFRPDNIINREEIVTIIYNFFTEYLGNDGQEGTTTLRSYSDASTISNWAYKPFRWAVGNGVIHGTSDTTLEPQLKTTRAQTANIIMQLNTLIKSKSN